MYSVRLCNHLFSYLTEQLIVFNIFSILTQMFGYFTGCFSNVEFFLKKGHLLQDPYQYSIGEELAT